MYDLSGVVGGWILLDELWPTDKEKVTLKKVVGDLMERVED